MTESKTTKSRKKSDIKELVKSSPIYGNMYRMKSYNKNTGKYIDDEFGCGLFDDGFRLEIPGINDTTLHDYEQFHLLGNIIVYTCDGVNLSIDIPRGRVYLGDYILVPAAEDKQNIWRILLAIAFVLFMIIKLIIAIWY